MLKLYAVKVWRTSEPRNFRNHLGLHVHCTPRARPGDRKLSRLRCTRAKACSSMAPDTVPRTDE